MTEEEIRGVVEPILRRHLEPFGFEAAEVASGRDHGGNPAIFISARYRPTDPEEAGKARIHASLAVRDALESRGEERYPYIRHLIPDPEPRP
ncbi:hypothetical protein [Salinarimonas sp.]|uniref:hypothetical protein n=1 Tax=Salinarimonas sp. TaxID=2766526 RepID=UPI0039194DFC